MNGINLNLGRYKKDAFKSFFRRRNLLDIIRRQKNRLRNIYIYIYIRFQKGFHTDIYFCFLARKLCAFFTCHCPTCEKSRFKDKFTLRQVLCSNLTKNECRIDEYFLQRMRNSVSCRLYNCCCYRIRGKTSKILIFTTTQMK